MFKSFNFRFSPSKVLFLSFLSTSSLVVTSPSHAITLNPSSWNSFGDVITSSNQVSLTNAFSDGFDDTENFNLSSNDPLSGTDLEFELGLPEFSDPTNFVDATEGSAIKTTVTVKTGDVLSFNWNFLTNDSSFNPEGVGDYAFLQVNDTLVTLGDTNSSLGLSSTNFIQETGSQNFSYTFSADGAYSLGLGIVDVIDTSNSSALVVDNIQVKTVPEPSTIFGLIISIGSFGLLKRRK
ncbi:MAG: PEP-CTERM sorting domain-containing protein [Trichodesmium sp. St19_bin1]|nr:PEP-CTERM sorting domain-containing protein [Trichodesmium sp. St19_bin1]